MQPLVMIIERIWKDLIKKANNKFAAMAQKLAVTETNRESSMNKVCMYMGNIEHF